MTREELAAIAAATVAAGLCGAITEAAGGGVCQLDPHPGKPHRARVGERIELPDGRGVRRNVIEWGKP